MQESEKIQTFIRYQQHNENIHYGMVEGDEIIPLANHFSEIVTNEVKWNEERVSYHDVKILEPVVPSKIINFGWTYAGHAKETGGEANLDEPFLFLKPLSSLIPNQENIKIPSGNLTDQVEMEGEVAIVVGKRGKNIPEEKAMEHVFGCTIFNDVTARDLTDTDPQFTRGKGFDTFGPLGPSIVKGVDPTNLDLKTTLNGKVVQNSNTNQMTLSIPFLISWVSQIMTLEPGDILATGSPSGSCPMKSGDQVTVEVEQIGKLCNVVT